MTQTDIIGRELNVGDFVSTGCDVCQIVKFTAKMAVVKKVDPPSPNAVYHKYGTELTKLPEADVLLWLIKK